MGADDDDARLEKVAQHAAEAVIRSMDFKKIVNEILLSFGINTKDPYEMQKDMVHLHYLRRKAEDNRKIIRRTLIALGVSALASLGIFKDWFGK